MVVRPTFRQQAVKAAYIHPDVGVWIQTDGLPINLQPPFPQGFLKRRQGTAQAGASATLVIFRPEQRGQCIAAVALPRNRQVDEERNGLATSDVNRLVVALDARRPKRV